MLSRIIIGLLPPKKGKDVLTIFFGNGERLITIYGVVPQNFEAMSPIVSCVLNIGVLAVSYCYFPTVLLMLSSVICQACVGFGDGPHLLIEYLVGVC